MSYQRLAYDDAATTDQMATDCAAVDLALQYGGHSDGHLPDPRAANAVTDGAYDTPVVSDDLAALAAGLELHFD